MPTSPPTPDDAPVLPFASFLQAHRSGASAEECSNGLRDLVAAVEEHGKKGTLVIKVVVEPASSDAHVLGVAIDVELRAPAAPAPQSIFYADTDHNLQREDPFARRLPLAGPTGVVDAAAGEEG